MEIVPPLGAPAPDLRGATVLLPAVAFYNVGELCVDALVTTLNATLAGRLAPRDVLPVVGLDAYGSNGVLATAVELYRVPAADGATATSGLFLLQQRAPAMPGRQRAYARELAQSLARAGVARVLVVSGLDAEFRRGPQLEGPQARCLAAGAFVAAAAAAAEAGSGGGRALPDANGGDGSAAAADAAAGALARLELTGDEAALAALTGELGAPPLEADLLARESELHPSLPPWPLLSELAAAKLPAALIGRFASEGDNVAGALALAALALRLLAKLGLLPPSPDAAAAGPAAAAAAAAGLEVGGGAYGIAMDAPPPPLPLRTPPSWAGLYGRGYEEVA